MLQSKLALVAAVAIAFASPAFAKTIRHSTATAPPASEAGNPYYAPYANQVQSSGNFIIPYGSH
jgi:hypothetical protein